MICFPQVWRRPVRDERGCSVCWAVTQEVLRYPLSAWSQQIFCCALIAANNLWPRRGNETLAGSLGTLLWLAQDANPPCRTVQVIEEPHFVTTEARSVTAALYRSVVAWGSFHWSTWSWSSFPNPHHGQLEEELGVILTLWTPLLVHPCKTLLTDWCWPEFRDFIAYPRLSMSTKFQALLSYQPSFERWRYCWWRIQWCGSGWPLWNETWSVAHL